MQAFTTHAAQPASLVLEPRKLLISIYTVTSIVTNVARNEGLAVVSCQRSCSLHLLYACTVDRTMTDTDDRRVLLPFQICPLSFFTPAFYLRSLKDPDNLGRT